MAGRMAARVALSAVLALVTFLTQPASAQAYRVMIRRLEANVYQALASSVIIETRACADLDLGDAPEEAILNWEGRFGHNWVLFTASRTRCDVATIR